MAATAAIAGLALVIGCAQPVPPPVAVPGPAGVEIRSEAGIHQVVLSDPAGVPVLTRRLPAPVHQLALDQVWDVAGTWSLQVQTAESTHQLALDVDAVAAPLVVEIEAPVGQGSTSLESGSVVALPMLDSQPTQVALTVTALADGPGLVRVGREQVARSLRAGERLSLLALVDSPQEVEVLAGGQRVLATLQPFSVPLADVAEQLEITHVDLPTDPTGLPELARPQGMVTLPAAWWRSTLRRLGLGVRAQDPWAPWAHVGVELSNTGDKDQNVVVRLAVVQPDGSVEPAFTPRYRGGAGETGAVQALLRIPAGRTARAVLPLYVDERELPSDVAAERQWRQVVEVMPLGSATVVARRETPLYVRRGSTAASLGLIGALGAAAAGTLLLLRRGPRWLSDAATSELMTIALFGSMTFLVGAVGRLLTMGVATVLGPFASLLTGLVDDSLRYALLATLVTLLPRPGTASLAVLVGWLLSGFITGTFSPTDVLFVGGRIFWLESLLWLAGVTRGRAWLDEAPWRRWLRLAVGFAGASALSNATGLVLHITLYRLFLADWYVALIIGLPGFLYVAVACALAVPFADSLRRIQR